MINRIIYIFIFLISSLAFGSEIEPYELKFRQEIKLLSKSFITEMEEKFDLHCYGEGGSMPHDLEEIDISFIAFRKGSINEARELIIKGTFQLTEMINTNKTIRPFLRDYPTSFKRVSIPIAFRNSNNRCYRDGSIVHAFQARENIFYYAEDALSEKRILIHKEPFEEALKIVTQTK
jgi:hypothetical protein